MDTVQLWYALSSNPVTSHYFAGVYARDRIPYLKMNDLVVCNTDIASEPGEHWVVLFRVKSDEVEFFDSLGKPFEHYFSSRKDLIARQLASYEMIQMSQRVQSPSTNLCGEYCLFYANARVHGCTMDDLIDYIPTSQTLRYSINNTYSIIDDDDLNVSKQGQGCCFFE